MCAQNEAVRRGVPAYGPHMNYRIAFADGHVEGYEEAIADVVAWMRIKYPRATSVPAQIERGDARGAARKAGNGAR